MAATDTQPFDRSVFAMELGDLELSETLRLLERLCESPRIKNATRVSLHFAVEALKREVG